MTVLQFLQELAQSPTRQLQFARDPERTARESGLPESVIPALASRDSGRLRELLAQSPETAVVYSAETAVVYSPETAVIYSPETAFIYSAETA